MVHNTENVFRHRHVLDVSHVKLNIYIVFTVNISNILRFIARDIDYVVDNVVG